jgi:protein gp37
MSTAIQWTDETWNPWWGCKEIAPECGTQGGRCYAAVFASRGLHPAHRGVAEGGEWTGKISRSPATVWQAAADYPRHSRVRPGGPTLVFTCSMSDFWHEDVPLDSTMALTQASFRRVGFNLTWHETDENDAIVFSSTARFPALLRRTKQKRGLAE